MQVKRDDLDKHTQKKVDYIEYIKANIRRPALPEQLSYIMLVDKFHQENNVAGSLGEIGVLAGDYLFGLGACARENERLVAIDLFDNQINNIDGSGSVGFKPVDYFSQEMNRRMGEGPELVCVQGDSLRLSSHDLLEASANQEYRIFSVDGGHEHYHLTNDLSLAEKVLSHSGVIIVDDYTNPGWPGVAEGVARYFLQAHHRRLAPFFINWNKLLLTTETCHAKMLKYFCDHCDAHGMKKIVKKLYGYDVLHAGKFTDNWYK